MGSKQCLVRSVKKVEQLYRISFPLWGKQTAKVTRPPCMLGKFLLAPVQPHTQQNPTATSISLGSFLGRPIPKCTSTLPPPMSLCYAHVACLLKKKSRGAGMARRLPYLPPSIRLRYQVAGTRGSVGRWFAGDPLRATSGWVGGQLSLEMGPTCELRLPARPCMCVIAGAHVDNGERLRSVLSTKLPHWELWSSCALGTATTKRSCSFLERCH